MKRSAGPRNTKGRRRDSFASLLRRRPTVVILAIGLTAVFSGVVMSRVEKAPVRITSAAPASLSPPVRSAVASPSRLHSRLSFQPEANKLRRRLGQRFVRSGAEVTMSTGSLTLDGQVQAINIARIQDESGEHVSIAVTGNSLLSWNPLEGALSNGAIPSAKEKSIVERIVLDSPDQFVLAQMRGASYFPIAYNVMPVADDNSESYSGASFDLVRIAEPQGGAFNKPVNLWRIYYINSATGLIDKIIYDEQNPITVELLGWTSYGGELEPSLIRWSQSGQILMELTLSSVSHGPVQ